MNLKQRRAQRHEMRTRERDRPLAFGARVGSSSFSTVGQLIGRASSLCTRSTKRARVGWCDQLLAAVVMVKSDMVLGVDRDNEREGSGGTASDATRRDGACATRYGISCTFVHRGVWPHHEAGGRGEIQRVLFPFLCSPAWTHHDWPLSPVLPPSPL